MNSLKIKKIVVVTAFLVSGIGGVIHKEFQNDANAIVSVPCCLGWGDPCSDKAQCSGQNEIWNPFNSN